MKLNINKTTVMIIGDEQTEVKIAIDDKNLKQIFQYLAAMMKKRSQMQRKTKGFNQNYIYYVVTNKFMKYLR